MAEVLLNQAATVAGVGDAQRAEALAEESLRIARQLGENCAMNLAALGEFAYDRGDLERARSLSLEALRVSEHAGRPWDCPLYAYWTLARVAARQGNAAEALARVRDALRWTQERDKHVGRTVPTLELLSMVDAMVGREVRVAYLQGALAVPIERTNAYRSPSWQRDFTAAVAKSRSAIGEEDWQAAYTAGRGLSLEEAVALALRTSE